MGLRFKYEIYSFYIAPCNGLEGAVAQYAANQTRNTEEPPSLFDIIALGSFKCVTQHMGPTALRPLEEQTALMVVVLLFLTDCFGGEGC